MYGSPPKPRSDNMDGAAGVPNRDEGDWGTDDGVRLARRWTVSAGSSEGGGGGVGRSGGNRRAKGDGSPKRNSLAMDSLARPLDAGSPARHHSPFGSPLGAGRKKEQPYQPYGSSPARTSLLGSDKTASADALGHAEPSPSATAGDGTAVSANMVGGKGSTATVEDMGGFLSKLALGF